MGHSSVELGRCPLSVHFLSSHCTPLRAVSSKGAYNMVYSTERKKKTLRFIPFQLPFQYHRLLRYVTATPDPPPANADADEPEADRIRKPNLTPTHFQTDHPSCFEEARSVVEPSQERQEQQEQQEQRLVQPSSNRQNRRLRSPSSSLRCSNLHRRCYPSRRNHRLVRLWRELCMSAMEEERPLSVWALQVLGLGQGSTTRCCCPRRPCFLVHRSQRTRLPVED